MATKTKTKTLDPPSMTDFLNLPLSSLVSSGFNSRKTFPEAALAELAESIRKVGVLQPIVVRPDEEGYAIVCGERRYRAAALAGLETIPAIVREMDDSQALEAAIVENLQREDVDPMEEADGFRALIASGQYDERTLAERLGRTIAYVVGRLRLANLSATCREQLAEGMPLGIAMLLAPFPTEEQDALMERVSFRAGAWLTPAAARDAIRKAATMPIAKAPWELGSKEFGRACTGCPKRTGNDAVLLPEFAGEDLCTSPSCWKAKAEKFAQELANENPDALVVDGVVKNEEEVQRKADEKRKIEIEKQARKLMVGVVLTLDFQYEAMRMAALCRLFWDQLGGNSKAMTWIAGQMGWEIPVVSEKSWENGAARNVKKPSQCIENLQDADALKLLRLLAVQRVLSADDEWALDMQWQQNAQPDPCALLEGLGVDVAFCRAKAADIVDEKAAQKAKGKA